LDLYNLAHKAIIKENNMDNNWKFGGRSEQRLDGIKPDIAAVTRRALELSSLDFGVTCGLRSQHEQNQLVATGKSQTKNSRHLTGDAVDVVAYHGGSVSWEMDDYVTIAEAFLKASKELDIDIEWGAAWLAPLATYESAKEAMTTYVDTRKSQGRTPLMDGPLFQLPWSALLTFKNKSN